MKQLAYGVDFGDYVTRPCRAEYVESTDTLWTCTPPVRFRAAIPTTWIKLSITEGKNRQVRRMTAAVSLGLQSGESVDLQKMRPWDGIA